MDITPLQFIEATQKAFNTQTEGNADFSSGRFDQERLLNLFNKTGKLSLYWHPEPSANPVFLTSMHVQDVETQNPTETAFKVIYTVLGIEHTTMPLLPKPASLDSEATQAADILKAFALAALRESGATPEANTDELMQAILPNWKPRATPTEASTEEAAEEPAAEPAEA